MSILPESESGSLDLTGLTIDRFTVLKRASSAIHNDPAKDKWVCKCTCELALFKTVSEKDLLEGKYKICRCVKTQKMHQAQDERLRIEREQRLSKKIIGDTAEILLTNGETAMVDAEDYYFLAYWGWWGRKAGYTYYATRLAYIEGKNKTVRMHRLVLEHHGADLGDFVVDHKDGNGLNNCKDNLRICPQSHNIAAQLNYAPGRPNKTSKYRGVSWDREKSKWLSRIGISVNGKKKTVLGGYFINEADAARRYNELSKKHFGEFGYQNQIVEDLAG